MSADYADRKYQVVPYDPAWTDTYESIATKVRSIFGSDARDIQHIGSTSVPGMAGKPTIDVLVLVDAIERTDQHVDEMLRASFLYAGQVVVENSRLFRLMSDNELLANIHVFPRNHPHALQMLSLRDYLRAHPKEVESYSTLKRDLYSTHEHDYANYRLYKDAYMADLIRRMESKAQNTP